MQLAAHAFSKTSSSQSFSLYQPKAAQPRMMLGQRQVGESRAANVAASMSMTNGFKTMAKNPKFSNKYVELASQSSAFNSFSSRSMLQVPSMVAMHKEKMMACKAVATPTPQKETNLWNKLFDGPRRPDAAKPEENASAVGPHSKWPRENVVKCVDDKNMFLGNMDREEAESRKIWTRRSQVFIYCPTKKAFLVQLRSPECKLYPHHWDLSTGGFLSADDKTDEINARKQVEEEIGINMGSDLCIKEYNGHELDFGEKMRIPPMRFVSTVKFEDKNRHYFCNIYLMGFCGDTSELLLAEKEVKDVEWWDLKQIN